MRAHFRASLTGHISAQGYGRASAIDLASAAAMSVYAECLMAPEGAIRGDDAAHYTLDGAWRCQRITPMLDC